VLSLLNRTELRDHIKHLPLLKRLAQGLGAGGMEPGIELFSPPAEPQLGWLVMLGSSGEGIAVRSDGAGPCSTPLARAVAQLRHAQRIAEIFGGVTLLPFRANAAQAPPRAWSQYRIVLDSGAVLCACSPRVLEGGLWISEAVGGKSMVRVSLVAELPAEGGPDWRLPEIPVVVPEFSLRGTLRRQSGGALIMVADDEREDDVVRVRVELGEIEIGVRELLGLRPGCVLDLGPSGPLECVLAIGRTALARASCEHHAGGFRLRVLSGP